VATDGEVMTLRAAGYIRVSTQEQADKGWNLSEDRDQIAARCEAEGWELVAIHDDGGRQGDDPDRPGLLALLGSLDEVDLVIMRQQDRISRDPVIWGTAEAAFRKAEVRVVTFTGEIDIDTPQGRFVADMFAALGKLEKGQTGQRVRQAMEARAKAGLYSAGAAPFGYRWQDKTLVVVAKEAKVVRRVFDEYLNGRSQKVIVRVLNAEGVPTPHGGPWRQSAIAKILGSVTYMGKLRFRGDVIDGAHEAIVTEEVWREAESIRTNALRRKGGRHPDGGHLLTGGLLRCTCGAAMLTRKPRAGVERARYVCSRRIEQGEGSCTQPSIRRELVDGPFLEHLLDGYLDLEAARRRIEEHSTTLLARARETVAEREAEVARIERALATTERDYDAGDITGKQYSARQERLTAELQGALNACEQAREHAQVIERHGPVGDAEKVLLEHLATIKRAVSEAGERAPDVDALRNVIGQLFESVQLARSGTIPSGHDADGWIEQDREPTVLEADGERYWLLLTLRWSAVDAETFSPIGQAMPSPEWQSYPHGFFSRHCWW
jgi:site-specific DNA recombinase